MGIGIAAAVILLIVALLFTKIRLLFQFSGGDITVAVKILFFRIDITEKAEEKINKNKYKIKKFRRRRDKVLKKYRMKTEKQNEKNAEPKENTEVQESEKTKKKMGPKQLVNMISELFGEILKRFPRYLHVEFKKLIIGVGGKDAADIAIKTGAVMQAVQYLVTSLKSLTNVRKLKGGQVYVYPVFVEGKWCAEVDISAYIRVGNVLRLGIIFIKNYLKRKIKNKK